MKKTAKLWKSIRLGLFVLAGMVVYAYGFQVTQVDLTEFRKESRQESRLRTLRQFARPDILEYEQPARHPDPNSCLYISSCSSRISLRILISVMGFIITQRITTMFSQRPL